MKLSFIIPAFNEEKYIGTCIQSILAHAPDSFEEIIVIDNDSTDATATVAASFPQVRVIHEHNRGPSFARQRGFAESKGTMLAYLDADCQLNAEWLPVVEQEFSQNPRLVCLSGPYKYTREELPKLHHRILSSFFWLIIAPITYLITRFAISGGNFVVKREALEKIGGIDTSIAFYGDDTNLARRLHKIGTVKFTTRLWCHTSGRRLQKSFVKTSFRYVLNYLSEAIFHKPVTKKYENVR